MSEKDIIVGAKIELTRINEKKGSKLEKARIYYSKVLDVEETQDGPVIKALMPIFEGRVVPLSVGTHYDIFFSSDGNIFESSCKVIGRAKEENVNVMSLVMTGSLKKVQRREYYRFPCYINVSLQPVDEWQAEEYERTHEWKSRAEGGNPKPSSGMLTDLSGGGMRIHSDEHFGRNAYIKISFDIFYNDKRMPFELLGMVVESYSVDGGRGGFETRIKFVAVPKEAKNTIIKYIYQEQRIAAKNKKLPEE